MKRLEKIIKDERNVGLDFIVHIQNKNELNDLIDVLTRCDFEIQLALEYSPDELKRWMEDIGRDYNYDTCFRIRNREDDKCVAHNPSVEHWRCFCNDIFEIRDGELEFNEGDYTLETARIEAKKIYEEIKDDKCESHSMKIFGFDRKMDENEIMQWLLTRFNEGTSSEKMQGIVKWFNNKLGYGFIFDGKGKEVFVHYSNIVSNKKFKKLYRKQKVDFDVRETEKGMQAVNVVTSKK